MYLVGYGTNSDGYVTPIMTNYLEKGVKTLYYDDGSCGIVMIDGFDDYELRGIEYPSSDDADDVKAAGATYSPEAAIILSIKEDDKVKFLIADTLDSEEAIVVLPLEGGEVRKEPVSILLCEAEEDDPDYVEFRMLIEEFV